MRNAINLLQQWSIPLIAGVFVALLVANVAPKAYQTVVDVPFTQWDARFGDGHTATGQPAAASGAPGSAEAAHDDGHHGAWWEHYITLHFLINDIFMVFFFGIATKEIVEACLPGGSLNPIKNAINPLLGTIGGVLGPIGVFLGLNLLIGETEYARGWGIPTATDIALAWLVARAVFGAGHPAISFLLLLAVADDAIGLGIIAFGYPDPAHPTVWSNALWIVPGMAAAFIFRKMKVRSWLPYVFIGGAFSWWGLYSAHLHPALALVPIVPFLPAGKRDLGLFEEESDYDAAGHHHHSTLQNFEHQLKLPVDFGLFLFAFCNAGVGFAAMSNLTLIVFLALLLGKITGITTLSWLGSKIGFPYPKGMGTREVFVASVVAAIGLTVALFVAGQAFAPGTDNQAAAKMGALFSGGISILAIIVGRLLGVRGKAHSGEAGEEPVASQNSKAA